MILFRGAGFFAVLEMTFRVCVPKSPTSRDVPINRFGIKRANIKCRGLRNEGNSLIRNGVSLISAFPNGVRERGDSNTQQSN